MLLRLAARWAAPTGPAAQGGPQAGSGPPSGPGPRQPRPHVDAARRLSPGRTTVPPYLPPTAAPAAGDTPASKSRLRLRRSLQEKEEAPPCSTPFLPFDRARPHHGPEDGGPSVCRRGRQTLVAPPPAGRPPRSLTVLVRGPWPHGDSRVEVRGFSGWGDGRAPASTETHAVHPGQHSDAPDVTVGVTSTTLTGESAARQQPE